MANKLNYSSFKEYPGPIKRQGPFSIDATSVYTSIDAARNYAANDPSAYIGQILTVVSENYDNSISVQYWGIKDEAGTLFNIMTADDYNQAINTLGRVMKYCGSFNLVNSEIIEEHSEHLHIDASWLVSQFNVDPQAGDVYNISLSDPDTVTSLHMRDGVYADVSLDNFDPEGGGVYFSKCEYVEGEGYCVTFALGKGAWETLPASTKGCCNMFAYSASGYSADDTIIAYCFYKTWEWTNVTIGNEIHRGVTVKLIDKPTDLDSWAEYFVNNLPQPEYARLLSAEEMYNKLVKDTEEGTSTPMLQALFYFVTSLRNGDNIVYNGHFWDVLAGPNDLSNFAIKADTIAGYGIRDGVSFKIGYEDEVDNYFDVTSSEPQLYKIVQLSREGIMLGIFVPYFVYSITVNPTVDGANTYMYQYKINEYGIFYRTGVKSPSIPIIGGSSSNNIKWSDWSTFNSELSVYRQE